MEDNERIALTILDQLGSNRFKVMTGAKHLSFDAQGALSFLLPIGKAGGCRIELDPNDTYTVIFYKREQWKTVAKNGHRTELSRHEGVYVDGLRELFERETGLYLTLGKVVFA